MGRSPCCNKGGDLNKGPWTEGEDAILSAYIKAHGEGNWRTLPKLAGLSRCGKSCRLRWINYLRPDLKRGNFSPDEDELIIKLHALLGNRWSLIAGRIPGRTDNEIKNYWNTHLKRKLSSMGIDPASHKVGLTPLSWSSSPDTSDEAAGEMPTVCLTPQLSSNDFDHGGSSSSSSSSSNRLAAIPQSAIPQSPLSQTAVSQGAMPPPCNSSTLTPNSSSTDFGAFDPTFSHGKVCEHTAPGTNISVEEYHDRMQLEEPLWPTFAESHKVVEGLGPQYPNSPESVLAYPASLISSPESALSHPDLFALAESHDWDYASPEHDLPSLDHIPLFFDSPGLPGMSLDAHLQKEIATAPWTSLSFLDTF